MNYRSIGDLSLLISKNLHKVPHDVELVVGIPRSGMLVASIIALKWNLPLTDLASFLGNQPLKKGSSRSYKMNHLLHAQDARRILLVDDSISSGAAMDEARQQLDAYVAGGGHVTTLVAYAEAKTRQRVDVHFETLAQPRMFEWNLMHHPRLAEACLDIDGVLCVDPTMEQNDDGPRYLDFVSTAAPLVLPTIKVKHIVTSRLEKYRPQTEAWLRQHGVQYEQLHMLDLPTAEERRRLNMHHKFKARIYAADPAATLFVESERRQAIEILRAANKPVFCTEDSQMYLPGASLGAMKAASEQLTVRIRRKLAREARAGLQRVKRLLGAR